MSLDIRNTRNKYGGEVIGAGGYGCVFKPALRCNNSKKRTKGISKLSSSQDSYNEWREIEQVKKYIEKIPNYENYFLMSNQTRCKPAKLTEKDKINLEICNNILGEAGGINPRNINNNLQNFHIINMPYGGKSLTNILINNLVPISTINIILINLLMYGIIPMNNLNIYHFDLKADNLLYKNNLIRIIDFGEMSISTPQQIIPRMLYNRLIQFNSPFSRILFGNIFDKFLTEYLNKINISRTPELLFKELQRLVLVFYINLKAQYGEGHEGFLSSRLLPSIFKLNNLQEPLDFNLLEYLVSVYCAKVLIKYIDFNKNTFNKNRYFEEVYSKNVDIYGFIISYIPIILNNREVDGTYKQQQIIIANIIIKYCLSSKYADIPINLSELITDLKELSTPKQNMLLNLELLQQKIEPIKKKAKSKKSKSKKAKSKKSKSKKAKSKKAKSKKA